MAFILILTLTCYSIVVISKEVTQVTGTGAWFTVLLTSIIFACAAAVIAYLNNTFTGETLYEYTQKIISKPVAYILAIYYILYFLYIAVFLVTEFTTLLNDDFFPRSPQWIFALAGIPVFCIIAYKGVTNIARISQIIGSLFLITALFVHILMLSQGKINRIMPFFNISDIDNYMKGFKYSVFPFMGVEVLLVIPFTKQNGKRSIRRSFFTVIFIGLFYILIIESCIMKVGIHDIINYKDPLIVAIRVTAPPALEFFSRLDILYLTIGFSGIFVGISIVLLAITEYLCRIFKKASRAFIVSIVGVIVFIIFLVVKNMNQYENFVANTGSYLGLASSILIPLLLLLIAKIRKMGQFNESNH